MKKMITGLVVISASSFVFAGISVWAIPPAEGVPQDHVAAARQEAKKRSEQAKSAAEARRLALSSATCSTYRERLKQLIPKLFQSVKTVQGTLDKKYLTLQNLRHDGTMKGVSSELELALEKAKAEAEVSVSMVDSSAVSVDCNNQKLGTELDTFRALVKEAKTSLQAYHKALVAVLVAAETQKRDGGPERAN